MTLQMGEHAHRSDARVPDGTCAEVCRTTDARRGKAAGPVQEAVCSCVGWLAGIMRCDAAAAARAGAARWRARDRCTAVLRYDSYRSILLLVHVPTVASK